MKREPNPVDELRTLWAANAANPKNTDYLLLSQVEDAYAARSRSGLPALIVPLDTLPPSCVGRRASGCELLAHHSTRLVFNDQDATRPVAALLCGDPDLVDAFAVLAFDVARRVRSDGATWANVLAAVEEWQTLLAPRGRPSAEAEAGLWGELWFASQAKDIERALAGWCGPEREATDFFVDLKGVEVKTSRQRRQHHVSQTQVQSPVGEHAAWLLSIWVKPDPAGRCTVATLVDEILERVDDRAGALRRIARAGYAPADRSSYTTAFVVLSEPEWYAAEAVPRVRTADPGVSQLRYRVSLDDARREDDGQSRMLWNHFLGQPYGAHT